MNSEDEQIINNYTIGIDPISEGSSSSIGTSSNTFNIGVPMVYASREGLEIFDQAIRDSVEHWNLAIPDGDSHLDEVVIPTGSYIEQTRIYQNQINKTWDKLWDMMEPLDIPLTEEEILMAQSMKILAQETLKKKQMELLEKNNYKKIIK